MNQYTSRLSRAVEALQDCEVEVKCARISVESAQEALKDANELLDSAIADFIEAQDEAIAAAADFAEKTQPETWEETCARVAAREVKLATLDPESLDPDGKPWKAEGWKNDGAHLFKNRSRT